MYEYEYVKIYEGSKSTSISEKIRMKDPRE